MLILNIIKNCINKYIYTLIIIIKFFIDNIIKKNIFNIYLLPLVTFITLINHVHPILPIIILINYILLKNLIIPFLLKTIRNIYYSEFAYLLNFSLFLWIIFGSLYVSFVLIYIMIHLKKNSKLKIPFIYNNKNAILANFPNNHISNLAILWVIFWQGIIFYLVYYFLIKYTIIKKIFDKYNFVNVKDKMAIYHAELIIIIIMVTYMAIIEFGKLNYKQIITYNILTPLIKIISSILGMHWLIFSFALKALDCTFIKNNYFIPLIDKYPIFLTSFVLLSSMIINSSAVLFNILFINCLKITNYKQLMYISIPSIFIILLGFILKYIWNILTKYRDHRKLKFKFIKGLIYKLDTLLIGIIILISSRFITLLLVKIYMNLLLK